MIQGLEHLYPSKFSKVYISGHALVTYFLQPGSNFYSPSPPNNILSIQKGLFHEDRTPMVQGTSQWLDPPVRDWWTKELKMELLEEPLCPNHDNQISVLINEFQEN